MHTVSIVHVSGIRASRRPVAGRPVPTCGLTHSGSLLAAGHTFKQVQTGG